MASLPKGWDEYANFKFLVAVGVLSFLYTLVLVVTYICRPTVDKICTYQPVIELVLDFILVVLCLAAGAAAATEAAKKFDIGNGDRKSLLDVLSSGDKSNLQASIVFTFFNMILFAISAFFSWKENAAEERKR